MAVPVRPVSGSFNPSVIVYLGADLYILVLLLLLAHVEVFLLTFSADSHLFAAE